MTDSEFSVESVAVDPITLLMNYDREKHKCPFFDVCKNPSKSEKWACVEPMQDRLKMCTEFYAMCVLMNKDRSPYDN